MLARTAGRSAVQVHPGNTADPTTVPDVIDTVKERFGIERVIFVGDRAMITDAHAPALKELGAEFVVRAEDRPDPQAGQPGELQLSLFDEINLAEITSTEFPDERLVVCRNPHVAAERARKREELLAATESRTREGQTHGHRTPAEPCARPTPAQIGERAGRVINKYKVAKHFNLEITDGYFSLPAQDRADHRRGRPGRPLRDPHHLPDHGSARPPSVRVYKQLKLAEHAYSTIKDTIEIRPIRHHLEDRVGAHFFLCMLAYYVALRTPRAPHAAAVHRRHPTHTHRPRRARPALPRRQHEGRQRPHRRRTSPPTPSQT